MSAFAGRSFTVLGGTGFVGGHVAAHLRAQGAQVRAVGRDWSSVLDAPLGHVVFAAGLTADFRQRPLDAIEAHVVRLAELLRRGRYDSLLYVSSTRLYAKAPTGDEGAPVPVDVNDAADLYAASKLAGESLCMAMKRSEVRVARLSNLFGPPAAGGRGMPPGTFLASVLASAREARAVRLETSWDSAKDFADAADAAAVLAQIAIGGRHRLYNVASGVAVDNRGIAALLAEHFGATVAVAADAPRQTFPPIAVDRIRAEFALVPASLPQRFARLVAAFGDAAPALPPKEPRA